MLNPSRKWLTHAAFACCGIALGTLAAWACGGGSKYPEWMLGRPWLVLDAPAAVFPVEIERLPLRVSVKALPADKDDPFRQTADADVADLRKDLAESGLPRQVQESLIDRYGVLRAAWSQYAKSKGTFHESAKPRPGWGPVGSDLGIPEGLPAEITDYIEGAIDYHRERFTDARTAWERLLARPAKERRRRSIWAAFMLGKLALRTGALDDAVKRFQQTRTLAAQHGFTDSLGLAAASLGWEARAELRRGHPEAALPLYARQARSGDWGALLSIEFVCRRVAQDGADAMAPIARDAEARQVFTAYLISRSQPSREDSGGSVVVVPALDAWLAAVRASGAPDVQDAAEAGRLAWATYQAGDFTAARAWLEKAPADDPMARWIRAKLLLRDGKLADAEPLLLQTAREITLPDGPDTGQYGGRAAIGPQASGEAAVARTDLGRYPEALDTFLRTGFLLDAAYIAEQVLTLGELKAYIDAQWPAALANRKEPDANAVTVRSLLGRRLVRHGRYREARTYLPRTEWPWLDSFSVSLRQGGKTTRPAARRAADLFRAACIERRQGQELFSTQLGPDWGRYEGQWDMTSSYPVSLADRTGDGLRPAADEEARRLRATAEVTPQKRFHYRYQAADLAWKAARLLPATSDRKAEILATAGTWLKGRDPEAANRFYKALAATRTDLGRQAAAMRWIPESAACEDDLLGSYRWPGPSPP
jgi:tetratricopeptide (TPR) repeat protein